MLKALCESPSCGHGNGADQQIRARPAAPGMRLCFCCLDKLAKHISRLPDLYRLCESILVSRPKREVERIRHKTFGGISLDEAVVSARSDIVSVLASWAGLVVDERRVSAPPQRQVADLAVFLSSHLEWLAAHPAAGDAVTEIHEVVKNVEAVVQPSPLLTLELGPCDRPGCESRVHVTLRAKDSLPQSRVCCESGHVWRPSEWLLLGHRIEQAQRALTEGRSDPGGHAA
jgi:hypothetical protein